MFVRHTCGGVRVRGGGGGHGAPRVPGSPTSLHSAVTRLHPALHDLGTWTHAKNCVRQSDRNKDYGLIIEPFAVMV